MYSAQSEHDFEEEGTERRSMPSHRRNAHQSPRALDAAIQTTVRETGGLRRSALTMAANANEMAIKLQSYRQLFGPIRDVQTSTPYTQSNLPINRVGVLLNIHTVQFMIVDSLKSSHSRSGY